MKYVKIFFICIFLCLYVPAASVFAADTSEDMASYLESFDGGTVVFKEGALTEKNNDRLLEIAEKYIKAYLSRSFDISRYDVSISEGLAMEDSTEYSLKNIRLSYKMGDFAAEDVYFIVRVCNDELRTIKQYGKADYKLKLRLLEDIDDEKMKKTAYEDAIKRYEDYKGEYAYKIVGQEFEKTVNIGERKAYYSVTTSYKTKDGVSRLELVKYELNAEFTDTADEDTAFDKADRKSLLKDFICKMVYAVDFALF